MVCPKCVGDMNVIAIIKDQDELRRILRHLVKIGRLSPWIRSRSAQLNVSSVTPRGTHVFVSRGKQTRNRSGCPIWRACILVLPPVAPISDREPQ